MIIPWPYRSRDLLEVVLYLYFLYRNTPEKVLGINSKIIQFSLALIERIQEIVKKHSLLLHTSNNEPFLENACCQSYKEESTLDYFVKQDQRIGEYNETVN